MAPDYDLDDPSTWPIPTPLEIASDTASDPEVLRRMAQDPSTDPEVLAALSERRHFYFIDRWVAENPNTSIETLERLLTYTTPNDQLDRLFEGEATVLRLNSIGKNPSLEIHWLIDSTFPAKVQDNRKRNLFAYLAGGYAVSLFFPSDEPFGVLQRQLLMRTYRHSLLAELLRKNKKDFEPQYPEGRPVVDSLSSFFRWLMWRVGSLFPRVAPSLAKQPDSLRDAASVALVWLAFDSLADTLEIFVTHDQPARISPGLRTIAEHFAPPGVDLLAPVAR